MAYVTQKEEGGKCYYALHGRITADNAAAAEAELSAIREQNPGIMPVLDASELEYIASAGLRVILRFRKREPEMRIINVSSEVYEIFDMTGFTEMIPVEKAYRVLSVEGCRVIGQGAKGTVYRWNPETIVKVYHDPNSLPAIRRERELARAAFVLGIPTAISYDVVKVGDSYGSVFELLDAETYSDLFREEPERFDELVEKFADLLRQIHSTDVSDQEMMGDIKNLTNRWLKDLDGALPAEQIAAIQKLFDAVPDVPTMIHGDFHSNNVMMMGGETLLIDMDTLAHGHPVFELASVMITYVGFGLGDPSVVDRFLRLDYELSKRIWKAFLKAYFRSDDAAYLASCEEKISLVMYVRLFRHTYRRHDTSESGLKTMEICRKNITELLEKVDDLTF